MKNWKIIIGIAVVMVVIAAILINNKQKMASAAPRAIQDLCYVSVENVSVKDISESLTITGIVNAYNDVNIISETQGKVTEVYAKVGDYKAAGSVLFQVDDELKRAAYISAEANYLKAKKDYERFQELYKQKSASESQLDQAKLGASIAESQFIVAKRQLEDTKIKTPISGIVTARYVDVGNMVQGAPQATLVANVVDINRLKVKLNVSESDVFKLKINDPVNVSTSVYPGVVFNGRIETISSKADEAHTYPVEVVVSNGRNNQLKAGMFARVEFTTLNNRSSLVVPRSALVGSIKNPQVFVVEKGYVKLRNLVLGEESGTYVHVMQGLSENDAVVTSGQNNLVENVRVEILK